MGKTISEHLENTKIITRILLDCPFKESFSQATQQVLPRCGGLELTEGLGLDSWHPVLPYLPTGSGPQVPLNSSSSIGNSFTPLLRSIEEKGQKILHPTPQWKRRKWFPRNSNIFEKEFSHFSKDVINKSVKSTERLLQDLCSIYNEGPRETRTRRWRDWLPPGTSVLDLDP